MDNTGFGRMILVVIIIMLVIAIMYFAFLKKTDSVEPIDDRPASTNEISSEATILAMLESDWQSVQAPFPFRPTYDDQVENVSAIWHSPSGVQFIGNNNILVTFEDDNNANVAVFYFNNNKFNLSELFRNQGDFELSDWQNLVEKYGDPSYTAITYTKGIIRDAQIVSFPVLTEVTENIFVKDYWQNQ